MIRCGMARLRHACLILVFLLASLHGGNVFADYIDSEQLTLYPTDDALSMVSDPVDPGVVQTAMHYLYLGAVHVLIGWDHLAFVFCLTLLASGLSLIGLITAFTLGHSLSLGLAHFGLIQLPVAPVEAIIALSIVFMAREAWLCRVPGSVGAAGSARSRPLITAFFGLIHGLGFASVLGDLGVSSSQRALALVFFNAGVEVGQVAFVLAVVALGLVVRKVSLQQWLLPGLTAGIGGMGVFWTLERVLPGSS